MLDQSVTRHQSGIANNGGFSNVRDTDLFSDIPVGDWTRYHNLVQDFDSYAGATAIGAGDWTLAGTGAATAALTAGDGGLLTLTNTAANNDFAQMQKTPAAFTYASGLPLWAHFKLQVDAVLGRLIVGMVNTTAASFTAANRTDGFYLTSDSTGLVAVEYAVGGVRTAVASVAQLVAAQQFVFRTYWDGALYASNPAGRLYYELSGPGVVAAVRGVIALPAGAAFPGAVNLAPVIALQNGSAVARSAIVDLVDVFKTRINPTSTPSF